MSESNRPEESRGQSPTALERPRGRRDFLKWTGASAAAVFVAACDDTEVRTITEVTPPDTVIVNPPDPEYAAVTLNFSNNFGVLNYAYALEQLEAAFYTQVVASSSFSTTFSEPVRRVLVDLRDHEIAHREFLRRAIQALGGTPIPGLTPNFTSIDFASRDSVLTTARTFEDLGVAAYNGAGPLLSNDDAGRTLLTVAGKIVSVEARHAAAIRDILSPRTSAFAPASFDDALPPGQVLNAAAPFIRNRITATNVPSIG